MSLIAVTLGALVWASSSSSSSAGIICFGAYPATKQVQIQSTDLNGHFREKWCPQKPPKTNGHGGCGLKNETPSNPKTGRHIEVYPQSHQHSKTIEWPGRVSSANGSRMELHLSFQPTNLRSLQPTAPLLAGAPRFRCARLMKTHTRTVQPLIRWVSHGFTIHV